MGKKTRIPHTYVIVFFIIILAAVLTWVVPPGKYVRIEKLNEGASTTELKFFFKDQIPEPFRQDFKSSPQTWQVFAALFNGFVKQSNIIIFILMIGGAFWILNQSRAIDAGIFAFLKFTRNLGRYKLLKHIGVDNIVIVLIMLMFSAFGAIFGMSEETIAFAIILVPLAISMGYDSIVGVCMVYVAAHLGFAGAILNPFTVGIAQGLSEIPLFSGIEYRIFAWVMINLTGFYFVLRYARKIRINPMKSTVWEEDAYWRSHSAIDAADIQYNRPRMAWIVYSVLIVALFVFSIIFPISELKIGNSTFKMAILPITSSPMSKI